MKNWKHFKILKSDEGFTLLEVLISLGIMVLIFSIFFIVQSNSIRATERSVDMSVVAMLAKNTITEMELDLEGKTFSEVKEEENNPDSTEVKND